MELLLELLVTPERQNPQHNTAFEIAPQKYPVAPHYECAQSREMAMSGIQDCTPQSKSVRLAVGNDRFVCVDVCVMDMFLRNCDGQSGGRGFVCCERPMDL